MSGRATRDRHIKHHDHKREGRQQGDQGDILGGHLLAQLPDSYDPKWQNEKEHYDRSDRTEIPIRDVHGGREQPDGEDAIIDHQAARCFPGKCIEGSFYL